MTWGIAHLLSQGGQAGLRVVDPAEISLEVEQLEVGEQRVLGGRSGAPGGERGPAAGHSAASASRRSSRKSAMLREATDSRAMLFQDSSISS